MTRIRKFAEPTLDADFFTLAFPDGSVTDEAGMDKFIADRIEADLARESDYLLSMELKNHLMAKANVQLPEGFLKNWLFVINEGKFTREQIDADFGSFLRMMAWDLVQKHFATMLDIEVTQDDMLDEGRSIARMQFAQYGMSGVPDETIDGYAKNILSNRQEAQQIYEHVREAKILDAIKPLVTVTEKSVSMEDFQRKASELAAAR